MIKGVTCEKDAIYRTRTFPGSGRSHGSAGCGNYVVPSVKLQIGDRDNRVITGMAVTGATTAGGNNIMNGEAIAGTHTDRRHRRATIRKLS